VTVLLSFSLAAYNLDRVRSFRAKREAEEKALRKRRKRRLGTWSALLSRDSCQPEPAATGPPLS
jgi:hypothetical protein